MRNPTEVGNTIREGQFPNGFIVTREGEEWCLTNIDTTSFRYIYLEEVDY